MKRMNFLREMFVVAMLSLISMTALAATPVNTSPAPGQFINGTVAIVNDGVITKAELNLATDQAIAQAKEQGMAVPDRLSLERQVLQNLISEKVALQLAQLNNINISSSQVQDAIAGIASRNNISVAQLQSALGQQGVSFASYEATIKKQLTINQLEQQAVASSIIVTPGEIDSYIAMQNAASGNMEYHVQHIMLPLPSDPTAANLAKTKQQGQMIIQKINQGMTFTAAAMKYSNASDALSGGDLGYKTAGQLPSALSNVVPTLQVGQIYGPFESDGAFHIVKLVAKKNRSVPAHFIDEYRINGIFMKTSPLMTADHVKQQLASLRSNIVAGASFSKLAEENSEDPISAKAGGDMGWQDPTQLNPAFAKAISSTPVGKVSQPFETEKGWYIIQVVDKRKVDDTANYERTLAQQAIFQRKAEQAVATWQAQIRGASYVEILDPSLQMPDAQS
ncbi:MAG: parvulin-like peptidyl-prolyl isomerase [Gammaproteobacteria bacterium]|jgi:peptidyl-prolyl cis-trans isomerase SurA|nr:parvulin-like peptidyl-prolyl isomerase [Gammaproteobacteria bacterium]